MGVWGKDIKGVKDLNKTLRTWEDLKIWSKETGKHPKEYFTKIKKRDKRYKNGLEEKIKLDLS